MKNIYTIISFVLLLFITSCSEETLQTNTTGNITGKVVLFGSNVPIENVKIATNPPSSTVFTNASGDFLIQGVSVGSYSVEASKEGLLTSFEGVQVVDGASVNTIFEMQENTASNTPPTQPNLLSPLDESIDQNIVVNLEWEASDLENDNLTYQLELRDGETSQIQIFDNLTATNFEVSGLRYSNAYFWQVSVNDGINTSVLSEIHSFETRDAPNDLIIYVKNVAGNDVIFSGEQVVVSGNDEIFENQLTDESVNSWRPRKNPTNTSVAFLRNVGAETHIFLMEADGTNVSQVTNTIPVAGFNHSEIDFSWSANGNQLLYPSFDKLYRINKDGTGVTLIYQTPNGSFITECDWSNDGSKIALKTNNVNGYDIAIYTIDMAGNVLDTVLSGVMGAAGGIKLSVDGTKLLYCYDVSGFESADYRQLNTHSFVYNFVTSTSLDVSFDKPAGFLDADPRFSPNEAFLIVTYSANNINAIKQLLIIEINDTLEREVIIDEAKMADW